MYVCLCNNINSDEVNKALDIGISESKKIYSYYNCKPKCGKCLEFINELIAERKKAKEKIKYEKVIHVANY